MTITVAVLGETVHGENRWTVENARSERHAMRAAFAADCGDDSGNMALVLSYCEVVEDGGTATVDATNVPDAPADDAEDF